MWRPIPGWRPSLAEVVGDGLEALTSANPAVAVHFWAVWNGVDPPMEGSIRAIQDRFAGRVMFVACDTDREENVRLCIRLGVVALPTLVVIASGRPPRLVVGYREPDALALAVEDALRPVPRPSWRFWGQGANAESSPQTPATVALLKRMDPPRHAFIFRADRLGEICLNTGCATNDPAP